MKILVTGMTSQQINERNKRNGQITITGAIASALRELGHVVEVGPYSIEKSLAGAAESYDCIFVGLGPLKGLGTSYCYQAIQAILDYSYRVILYVDDTATQKIGREFRTILSRPTDYNKPFFMYKREWAYISNIESDLFKKHLDVIDTLAGNTAVDDHPVIVVPSWTFDLAYSAANKLCSNAANNVFSFEPSDYFDVSASRTVPEHNTWGTVYPVTSPAVNKMGVRSWEVETVTDPRQFGSVSGILVPQAVWSPDIANGVKLGVPVASDWRTLGPQLGESFEALPANIELMNLEERDDLAKDQLIALKSKTFGSTSSILKQAIESTFK